jgi:hypothetical protein
MGDQRRGHRPPRSQHRRRGSCSRLRRPGRWVRDRGGPQPRRASGPVRGQRAGNMFVRTQTAASVDTWSPWLQSVQSGWYSVVAQATVRTDRADGPGGVAAGRLAPRADRPELRVLPRLAQMSGLLTSVNRGAQRGEPPGVVRHQRPGAGVADLRERRRLGPPFRPGSSSVRPGAVVRSIVAETNAQGLVEVFSLTNTGQIWHRWQTSATATTYSPVGPARRCARVDRVARNRSGALELFGVNAAGQVFQRGRRQRHQQLVPPGRAARRSPGGRPAALASLPRPTAEGPGRGLRLVNAAGQIWRRWADPRPVRRQELALGPASTGSFGPDIEEDSHGSACVTGLCGGVPSGVAPGRVRSSRVGHLVAGASVVVPARPAPGSCPRSCRGELQHSDGGT